MYADKRGFLCFCALSALFRARPRPIAVLPKCDFVTVLSIAGRKGSHPPKIGMSLVLNPILLCYDLATTFRISLTSLTSGTAPTTFPLPWLMDVSGTPMILYLLESSGNSVASTISACTIWLSRAI